MSAIPIYRLDDRHPQAKACADCEVRSSALFGALDDAALDDIHTSIESLTIARDITVYDRGSAGRAVYTMRRSPRSLLRSKRTRPSRIV